MYVGMVKLKEQHKQRPRSGEHSQVARVDSGGP